MGQISHNFGRFAYGQKAGMAEKRERPSYQVPELRKKIYVPNAVWQ